MRTLLALAFVLGACGGDDVEPQFEVLKCSYAPGYPKCQRACLDSTPTPASPPGYCETGHTEYQGQTLQGACGVTIEWEGLEGCCKGDGDTIFFVQCD